MSPAARRVAVIVPAAFVGLSCAQFAGALNLLPRVVEGVAPGAGKIGLYAVLAAVGAAVGAVGGIAAGVL